MFLIPLPTPLFCSPAFYCRYAFVGDEDYVGTGIGCVVRAKPGSLRQETLECFSIDAIDCDAPELDFEEVVSNVICLQSKEGILKFEVDPNNKDSKE